MSCTNQLRTSTETKQIQHIYVIKDSRETDDLFIGLIKHTESWRGFCTLRDGNAKVNNINAGMFTYISLL